LLQILCGYNSSKASYFNTRFKVTSILVFSCLYNKIVFNLLLLRRATGWTIGVLGFDSRRCLGLFIFTTAFRTALEPTQPPIQWVPGAFSLGVKLPGREADHSPPSSAEVIECVELYLHSPSMPSWRGTQLKRKHTGNFTFSSEILQQGSNYVCLEVNSLCLELNIWT